MTILTTDLLLDRISKKAQLTGNQGGFSNTDLLNLATDEMVSVVFEHIIGLGHGYCVWDESIAVSAGQERVRIPYRAYGGQLTHLYWQDSVGNRTYLYPMTAANLDMFVATDRETPYGFMVQGNSLRFMPLPMSAGSLVVLYPFTPSALVTTDQVQTITAVNVNGPSVSFNTTPSQFTTSVNYDVVDNLSGNGIIAYDLVPASLVANVLTFQPGTSLTNVQVGQWISVAGTSKVPMLPEPAHDAVVEAAAARALQERGALAEFQIAQQRVTAMLGRLTHLLSPSASRVDSKPQPIGGGNPIPSRVMGGGGGW